MKAGKKIIAIIFTLMLAVTGITDGSFALDDTPSNTEPTAVSEQAAETDETIRTEAPAVTEEPAESEAEPAAQTFTASDGGIKVTAEAPEGAFPGGVTMTVNKVEDADTIQTIRDSINDDKAKVTAVDITFQNRNGKDIQPSKPIQITIRSDSLAKADDPIVIHVPDQGEPEQLTRKDNNIESDTAKKEVSFEADSFSVYAVVDEDETVAESRATVHFYDKTGALLSTVYVKNGDTLAELGEIVNDPGTGVLADDDLFVGWSISTVNTTDGSSYTIDTPKNSIEQVRSFLESAAIAEGDVYNIYAMVFKGYSVQFKDEDGITIHSEILLNRNGEPVPYTVNTLYTPKSQDSAFLGWNVTTGTDVINPSPEEMTETGGAYPNGTEVTISGNVIFSPKSPLGFWLIFRENGSGVSYTSPQFIEEGHTPTEPAEPTRSGYTFGGWYTSADCLDGQEFDFNSELTRRTTVYAKWIPSPTADYTVIVWKQSVADSYDTADGNKTYDFVFSKKFNTNSNTPISSLDLSAYTSKDGQSITVDGKTYSFYGFKYNTTKGIYSTDTVVKPNGTTVINIYYDREVVTYDFRVYGYDYTISTSTSTGYYYIPDGNGGYTRVYLYRNNGRWYRTRSISWSGWVYSDEYVGDVYNRSNNQTWHVRDTFTGLYGQKLSKYGYTWPTEYRWFTEPNGNTFVSLLDSFESSMNDNPQNEFHSDFYGNTFTANTNVYHYLQNEDGTWPQSPTYTVPTNVGSGMVFRSFSGFTREQFRIKLPDGVSTYYTGTAYNGDNLVDPQSHTTTDGWTEWLDYGTGVEYAGNTRHETTRWAVTEGGIEFRYTRNSYNLSFMVGTFKNGSGEVPKDEDGNVIETLPTGTLLKEDTGISYEESLANYAEGGADYYEPPSIDGFAFAGWYIDPDCTTEADLANMTMPINGAVLYAKWVQVQYRVFMHPNVSPDDTSLDWGGQSMCFRVDAGAHVAGGNDIIGTRDDYDFIGWYTDEACTQPFNFAAFELNDTTVTTLYDQTQSTELNKYGLPNSEVNSDAENNRTWITRKLDLYGKWRAKLNGARGINVIYSDDDTKHDIEGNNDAPTDSLDYLDNSEAVAGKASTPSDNDYQFLYWVVQTWDESQQKYVDQSTEVRVYPGDTFSVLKANAHRTNNPDWAGEDDPYPYLYTVQLRAEYGPKDTPADTHITWHGNGGELTNGVNYSGDEYVVTNDADADEVEYTKLQINEAVPIVPANTFTRYSYRFIGWAKSADATEPWLVYDNATDTFTVTDRTGTHTVTQVFADERQQYDDLYALWEKATYTVTIRKHILGDYSDMTKSFIYTPSESLDENLTQFILTDYNQEPGNEKVYSDVDHGTVINITEETQGYTVTGVVVSKFSDAELTNQVSSSTIANGADITVDNYVLIEYTNQLDIVITGIRSGDPLYVLPLITLIAILLLLGYIFARNRRRRRMTEYRLR